MTLPLLGGASIELTTGLPTLLILFGVLGLFYKPQLPQVAISASLIAGARRLAALLALPFDNDVDLLRSRLGTSSGATRPPVVPVVLCTDEHWAYKAVTERILAAWHVGDPLARFLYRGERA